MAVPITEEFDHPQGQYVYYDSSDVAALTEARARRHIDLRTLGSNPSVVPQTMFSLSLSTSVLNGYTMEDMEGTFAASSEIWTVGEVGPDPALGNRNSLRLALDDFDDITTESAGEVDLTAVEDTDELSVALPSFPSGVLDLPNSYLELVQGDDSVQLPFTGLGGGNVEAKWPVSALGDIRKPDIVRFFFAVTSIAPTPITIAAIRVLSPDWTPAHLDIQTVYERLQPTVTRIGTIPTTPFPKLWRAADPVGDDPRPINSKLALSFNTGSMSEDNSVTFFLRGRREDFLTQLDLDGTIDQGELDAYGRQPDYGQAMYDPVPQSDYDTLPQSTMNTYTQAELERVPDFISEAWIEVDFHFGVTNFLHIGTTESLSEQEVEFTFAGLDPNSDYVLLLDLIDSSLRARIFTVDTFGQLDRENPVFDSYEITDDFLLKRRKGRIGWAIDLQDGDAHVDSIRSRGLMFGEIITQNFESLTPVEGARIFAGATPDRVTNAATVPFGNATVTVDTLNARSEDGSAKVEATMMTGVQTELIPFEDFENTEFEFDLYYPSSALDTTVGLYLLSTRNLFIPIQLPTLVGDQWRRIRVAPYRAILEQTGAYRLVFLQQSGSATFWIDNVTVRQRSVAWSGRASLADPWGSNRNAWTQFRNLVNSETDGVVFPERGRFLQVRGQALTQEARIDRVYAKPKYAELGRFVWDTGRQYQ